MAIIRQRVQRQSLHESLVAPVRDMIVSGELRAGEKVPEEALCERFGVSRTPIREALKVLAAEGVLQILPHRGAIVAQITEDQVGELYPIMAALERLAGKLACENGSAQQIGRIRALHNEMVKQYKKGDEQAYLKSNRAIHEAIFQMAGNETLSGYYQQILVRIHGSRFVTRKTKEQWDRAVNEHKELLAALEDRDGDRLGAVLETHVLGTAADIARTTIRGQRSR